MTRRAVWILVLPMTLLALLGPQSVGLPSTAARPAEATVAQPIYWNFADYDWVAVPHLWLGGIIVSVGMPGPRKVMVQTGSIVGNHAELLVDDPVLLYQPPKGVNCDGIEGRSGSPVPTATSPYDRGGVALTMRCGRTAGDAARSVALVTADLLHWARMRVDRYAAPAVSPSGTYAAWLTGRQGEYVTWSPATGFSAPTRTTYRFDSGGETLTVDDVGTVTVLGPERAGRTCVVGVHTRTLAGAVTHAVVRGTDPGCADGRLENVDTLTVSGGDSPETGFTVSRATVDTPWHLTRAPAIGAPGLVKYQGSRDQMIRNRYLVTDGREDVVISVGSPDRRHIMAQRYDASTRAWGPPTQIYDAGRTCEDAGFEATDPRGVYAIELTCGRSRRVLASAYGLEPDAGYAAGWAATTVGDRPWIIDGSTVAVPGKHSTVLLPVGLGESVTTTVPVTTGGRCDVVFPLNAQDLLRIHGRGAWPSTLQVFYPGYGWTTIGAVRMPGRDRCRSVRVDNTLSPSVLHLQGRRVEVMVDFRLSARTRQWEVKPVHRAP